MRQTERRVRALEAAQRGGQQPGCIVLYDSETGQPLAPIRKRAAVQIWLPANYREGAHGKPQRAPAESA